MTKNRLVFCSEKKKKSTIQTLNKGQTLHSSNDNRSVQDLTFSIFIMYYVLRLCVVFFSFVVVLVSMHLAMNTERTWCVETYLDDICESCASVCDWPKSASEKWRLSLALYKISELKRWSDECWLKVRWRLQIKLSTLIWWIYSSSWASDFWKGSCFTLNAASCWWYTRFRETHNEAQNLYQKIKLQPRSMFYSVEQLKLAAFYHFS